MVMPTLAYPVVEKPFEVAGGEQARIRHCKQRAAYLQKINEPRRSDMARIRAIMNGGPEGMVALLGPALEDFDPEDQIAIPAANLILSGVERAAHRLGKRPTLRVDPPVSKQDSDRPQEQADKRERIVEAYDDLCRMEMLLPQVARWIIGYGFAPMVVTKHKDPEGHFYPNVEIRDPFTCWPAPWGVTQQPRDIAFVRRVPAEQLIDLYPWAANEIDAKKGAVPYTSPLPVTRVGDTGGIYDASRWENPTDDGIAVVEYYDAAGKTVFSPQCDVILDHQDNPLASGRPLFVVLKRFAFDRLQGQFDQGVGLMASIAKVNLLVQIAMEEAVFGETNIFDSTTDASDYLKGRDAVNVFETGARVEKPASSIPYQMFQHVALLEDQLRKTTRYSRQEDGESPTSWATGRGLESLATGANAELDEIRIVFRYALQDLDSIRLEYDESRWPDEKKPLVGERDGAPFVEDYTPRIHIRRNYRTKRIYGAMAGWDDPTKVVTGLQLRSAGSMSNLTFMQNIDGLDNISRELQRIDREKAKEMAYQVMMAKAAEGDERAMLASIEIMNGADPGETMKKYYTPAEPQMSPEEAALMQQAAAPAVPQEPEDVQTLLTRLTTGGDVQGGVQVVGAI